MADSGFSNTTRVNADGSVTSVFPGGVELPLINGGATAADNAMRWVRQSDGSLVAESSTVVTGSGLGAIRQDMVQVPGGSPRVSITQQALSGSPVNTRATVSADAEFRTILNANGESSFVQNPGVEDVRMTSGSAQMTWTGGYYQETYIAHGLGVVPTSMQMSGLLTGSLYYNIAPLGAAYWDASYVLFTAQTFDGSGLSGTYGFTWICTG